MEAPTCFSSDQPTCDGYDSLETCTGGSWAVVATLQDTRSGLSSCWSPSGATCSTGLLQYVMMVARWCPLVVGLDAPCSTGPLQYIVMAVRWCPLVVGPHT